MPRPVNPETPDVCKWRTRADNKLGVLTVRGSKEERQRYAEGWERTFRLSQSKCDAPGLRQSNP